MPGSHGSLTKAGKVKMQTPKVERSGVNSRKKSPLESDSGRFTLKESLMASLEGRQTL